MKSSCAAPKGCPSMCPVPDSIEEEAEALKQEYILQLRSGGRILSYRWAKWRRENGLPLSVKGKGGAAR